MVQPRPRRRDFTLLLAALLCLASGMARAESGYLVVHVEDTKGHPIGGVRIGTKGDGGTASTADDGKARIRLAKETKEGSFVPLQIVESQPGKDFEMISPWDREIIVPSFANESKNFVNVVVVQRGDRMALESGTALAALAAQINKANAPKSADKQAPPEDPKANLAAVAKQYGLSPEDLDQAIRVWGAKATDPYEAGLAALYERNYPKASAQLADSLQKREEKLTADQKAVADAAFFLGLSLYGEGKYKEAATDFQRCLQFRPADTVTMNFLEVSLAAAGEYAAAEPLARRALIIDENAFGHDHPTVASDLNNLASLLQDMGQYPEAESLFQRSLAIYEMTLPRGHPLIATGINNLGLIHQYRGDYAGAEQCYRRALAIDEKLSPESLDLAIDLNNLGIILEAKHEFAEAETFLRRALAINEKILGSNHPEVARSLNNLASLLQAKGDYAGAEALFRQALAIKTATLGPNHPSVATSLINIASLLETEGDYAGAEPLFRRALAIDERALGSDHPGLAIDLDDLAVLLTRKKEYAGAEPLLLREVAVDERSLGSDHLEIARVLNNLAELLEKEGEYSRAEPFLRQALGITERTLGPDHPITKRVRQKLQALLDKESAKKTER